jgi:hypothetical protein
MWYFVISCVPNHGLVGSEADSGIVAIGGCDGAGDVDAADADADGGLLVVCRGFDCWMFGEQGVVEHLVAHRERLVDHWMVLLKKRADGVWLRLLIEVLNDRLCLHHDQQTVANPSRLLRLIRP